MCQNGSDNCIGNWTFFQLVEDDAVERERERERSIWNQTKGYVKSTFEISSVVQTALKKWSKRTLSTSKGKKKKNARQIEHGWSLSTESTRSSSSSSSFLCFSFFLSSFRSCNQAWLSLHQNHRKMYSKVSISFHTYLFYLFIVFWLRKLGTWRVNSAELGRKELSRVGFLLYVCVRQVLEQPEGGVAEDGPTDIDGVEGVRIEGIRTVQIWSDVGGSDGEERPGERVPWAAEAGERCPPQLLLQEGLSLHSLGRQDSRHPSPGFRGRRGPSGPTLLHCQWGLPLMGWLPHVAHLLCSRPIRNPSLCGPFVVRTFRTLFRILGY